jgi:hypothetical protein
VNRVVIIVILLLDVLSPMSEIPMFELRDSLTEVMEDYLAELSEPVGTCKTL